MIALLRYFKVAIAVVLIAPFSSVTAVTQKNEPESAAQVRRLNEQQYRNSIADILGDNIEISGRFEPELRNNGLLALGSSIASVTPFGFEQFDIIARSVAKQFVLQVKQHPAAWCAQTTDGGISEACAIDTLKGIGKKLFRRPLSVDEQQLYAHIFDLSARKKDNYAGLEASLSGMLVAPPFLFRIEGVEPDPNVPGNLRLTAYAKAQRLSYFLWDTTPDSILLDAAERGELHTREGLEKQIDRLLNSPRLEAGVRALFNDMLRFDEFDKLVKDAEIFPRFNFKTALDAKEETLRTIVDHLLKKKADYRTLFTTQSTFLTPALGLVYRVPIVNLDGWTPYTFTEKDKARAGGRAGLLTHVSFLALHSHPGRSSVTLRGKAVRELILCQMVPTPPANVNFNLVQDTTNPKFKTTRDRVMAHQDDPGCAGCHKITDPIGLALENFDGSGVFQLKENGVVIDTSGSLDGQKYSDAAGLAKAVAEHPDTPQCLVRRSFEIGTGRALGRNERDWVKRASQEFGRGGYTLPSLLRQLTTSERFFELIPGPAQTVAIAPFSVVTTAAEES